LIPIMVICMWWWPGWGWGWRGRGRGWGRGWGGGWAWFSLPLISQAASRGYYYIGPCRSGIGPFAFYMTPSGQIVHAWQLFGSLFPWTGWGFPGWTPTTTGVTSPTTLAPSTTSEKEALERERDYLRRELEQIERRIRELEGQK